MSGSFSQPCLCPAELPAGGFPEQQLMGSPWLLGKHENSQHVIHKEAGLPLPRGLFSTVPLPPKGTDISLIYAKGGQANNESQNGLFLQKFPVSRGDARLLFSKHTKLCTGLKHGTAKGKQPLLTHKSSCQGKRKAQHGFSSVFKKYSRESSSQS